MDATLRGLHRRAAAADADPPPMTTWRGVTLDGRSAQMMDEVARLTGDIYVDPTQGSYSGSVGQSAGTHDGGGAIDIACAGLSQGSMKTIETCMREVGWAAWIRDPSQGDWPWHIHGIAVGCPDLAPAAADQVDDYNAGRNGLANNGPDTGTRQYVGVTWESYQEDSVGHVDSISEGALASIADRVDLALGAWKPNGKPRNPDTPEDERKAANERLRLILKYVEEIRAQLG